MNPLLFDTKSGIGDPKIIVALDYNNKQYVINLVNKLNPDLCKLKVGKELFTSLGPEIVKFLINQGYDVFLDLKFHDIPNTVYSAIKSACDLGVWMVNVHTSGGNKMMTKAAEACNSYQTLLVGVTVLTSMSESDYNELGYQEQSLANKVISMSENAFDCGLNGVVCSAMESSNIKSNCGSEFLCVTPGIRLIDDSVNDQSRVMTPELAIISGASYLVMGRSITGATDPMAKLMQINQVISNL